MNVVLDFSVIFERWPELLRGTFAALGFALAGMTLALTIGVIGVAIRRSGRKLPAAVVIGFVDIVRNTNGPKD